MREIKYTPETILFGSISRGIFCLGLYILYSTSIDMPIDSL
jgi:hypothetical protein